MITDDIGKSKYKGVRQKRIRRTGEEYWEASGVRDGRRWYKKCDTERDAAIAYDKIRLEQGKEPINILKRK